MNQYSKTLAGLLATSCLFACATPVFAQNEAAPGAAADSGVADIIVTATRRNERLQDVPISVNVLSADKLAETGFKAFNDIQYQMTGVYVGTTPNDSGIRLRGVGSAGGFSSSSEKNVGLVVDSVVVPFGNPIASLGDVERVEVLKGPQGTQFGKNASSGVVSITTARPKLGDLSGSVFGSYGSLNERDIHGQINVPLGATVAAQVFVFDRANDGYVHNAVQNRDWGGSHIYGTRSKILWQPSDNFSALLIGDYSREKFKGNGQLWTLNRFGPGYDPGFNPPFTNAALGLAIGPDNDVSIDEYGTDNIIKNYGASLEMNLGLGDYNLTSVTGWRENTGSPSNYSIDGSPLARFTAQGYGERSRFYSQELRLASPSGATFEYIVGLYASRLEVGLGGGSGAQIRVDPTDPSFIIDISNGIGHRETRTDSLAAFVDGTVALSDRFKLIVGGRLTRDKVRALTYSVIDPAFPPGGSAAGFVVPYSATPLTFSRVSGTDWSGRFGFEYKPKDDILLYATIARGYLGPTTTFSILSNTQAVVKPQTVNDITVGAKMQFADRKLTLNVNAFYDKYKNLQTSIFKNAEFINGNAGGLKARGFEIEAIIQPIRNWGFNLGYTYSKATYTDYLTTCPLDIQLGLQAGNCTQGASGDQYQAAGQDLPGAPRHTITAGTNFRIPLGDALQFDGAVNYYYRDKVYQAAGENYTRLPDYSLVNLNFGLGDPDGKWRIGAFARNLFDKKFNVGLLGLPFANTGTLVNWKTRDGRRTLGVMAETKF